MSIECAGVCSMGLQLNSIAVAQYCPQAGHVLPCVAEVLADATSTKTPEIEDISQTRPCHGLHTTGFKVQLNYPTARRLLLSNTYMSI